MPSTTTLGASVVADETSLTKVGSAIGWKAQLTAKGDLETYTGSAYSTLAVGTNGQVLSADSTAAGGVSWASPGGVVIASGTITAQTAVTLVTGLGTTYKKIRVFLNGNTAANSNIGLTINGNSGAVYQQRKWALVGTAATATVSMVSIGTTSRRQCANIWIARKAYTGSAGTNRVIYGGTAWDNQNAADQVVAGDCVEGDVTSIELTSSSAFTGEYSVIGEF